MRARPSTTTHVSLPARVEGAKAPPRPNQLVRLTKRTSNVDVHDGTTVLEGDGEQVVISASTAPIVDRLAAGEPVTIAELAAAVPDVPLDEVRAMVATLISQAVVHTAP